MSAKRTTKQGSRVRAWLFSRWTFKDVRTRAAALQELTTTERANNKLTKKLSKWRDEVAYYGQARYLTRGADGLRRRRF